MPRLILAYFAGVMTPIIIILGVVVWDVIGQPIAMNFVETTKLRVEGQTLYMDGTINSKTPQQFYKVFEEHPDIHTVVMLDVPGSVDDGANLEIATWLTAKDLTTKLLEDSHIASGGTDFFLVGDRRIVTGGAQIGVHAWAGTPGSTPAPLLDRNDPEHQKYIDFYMAAGLSPQNAEEFYFFTLNAAPAHDMYYMTKSELLAFNLATEIRDR